MIPLKCVFYLYPDSPKSSPRNQANRQRAATLPTHRDGLAKESTPKHDIVVVADGQTILKGITQSYFIYIYILLSLNTTLFYIIFQTFVHVYPKSDLHFILCYKKVVYFTIAAIFDRNRPAVSRHAKRHLLGE